MGCDSMANLSLHWEEAHHSGRVLGVIKGISSISRAVAEHSQSH